MKNRFIFKILSLSVLLINSGCSNKQDKFPVFINTGLSVKYRLDNSEDVISLNDQFSAIWSDDMSFIVQPNSKESQSNSSKFKVNSCESMLIARKNNYDLIDIPSSGPYNAMYIKCQAINLVINKIKKSEISHIHDYILDENSVTYLPKQIALITSSSRYKSLMADQKLKTINDVNHIINIKQLNNNTISFSNDNASRQKISILAKGDFNHDAIEDIMLSVSNSVIGGSYTSYYLYILTKTEKDGDWIVLDEYPNN